MVIDSPYMPGAGLIPPQRAGRSAQFNVAVDALIRTENYGAPRKSPAIYTGVRGMGKTVLLRSVQDVAEHRNFLVARSVADARSSLPQRIATDVAAAVTTLQTPRKGVWDRLTTALGRLNIELDVAGLLKITRAADPKTSALVDRDALLDVLAGAADIAREHGRQGLCLTLDELQSTTDAGAVTIAHVLQELGDERSHRAVVVVGAGLPNTPDVLATAGTFTTRFGYYRLDGLTPSEILEGLLPPANRLDVRWSEPALRLIQAETKGSPYLLQLYADNAWRIASPTAGTTIDLDVTRSGITAARQQLRDGLFRTSYNRATPTEREFLHILAQTADAEGTAPISDIAADLGKTRTQLSTTRARLIDKGLIESTSYGTVSFVLPGFADYVREQHGDPAAAEPASDREQLLRQIEHLQRQLDTRPAPDTASTSADTAPPDQYIEPPRAEGGP